MIYKNMRLIKFKKIGLNIKKKNRIMWNVIYQDVLQSTKMDFKFLCIKNLNAWRLQSSLYGTYRK